MSQVLLGQLPDGWQEYKFSNGGTQRQLLTSFNSLLKPFYLNIHLLKQNLLKLARPWYEMDEQLNRMHIDKLFKII